MVEMRLKIHILFSFLVYSMFLSHLCGAQLNPQQQTLDASKDSDDHQNIIHIGLIVDMGSSTGKVVVSCVNMAISDSNGLYRQNGTLIVLHTRDTKGEPFNAITAARDLLESIKVEAIIVPEMTSEASMMATLGDKANVPILSFTSIPFSTPHPYFLQISEEENIQFKGITAFLETFNWRNIVLIHEDTDDGRNILPHILEEFQERNIRVIYKNAMALSGKGDQIIEELRKLKMMHTPVFIVHTSPSVASKIFINSKRLGMMSEGYAWLITSKTMNFLDSLDPLVIESMQGALGLKSYIPASSRLQNFTLRWKSEVQYVEPSQELRDLKVLGIRTYDMIWALAKATTSLGTKLNFTDSTNTRVSNYGSEFLSEILKSEFTGLGGGFRFVNGKLVFKGHEVVNVIGKGERIVGFWTMANGFTKANSLVNGHGSPNPGLEIIIWPGISTNAPKGLLFQASGKKLRVGIPVKVGFQEFIRVQRDIQNNAPIVTGFCLDVFAAAIDSLRYAVSYEFVPFEQGQGSYNDLIYGVYSVRFPATSSGCFEHPEVHQI